MTNHSGRTTRTFCLYLGSVVSISLFFLSSQLSLIWTEQPKGIQVNVIRWTEGGLPPDNRRIYFHETSGNGYLNVRQSCAVESAARHNPTRPVQLFLHADRLNYSRPFLSVLQHYSNVVVVLLNETEYFLNTPLEKWFIDGEWRESMYKIVHMADYIRMLNLFKGGGMYMDLDYITLKKLDEKFLQNFFLVETKDMKLLSNSAFHLVHQHRLIHEIIKRLVNYYKPDEYFWHGPSLLSNVMSRNCSIKRGDPNSNKCTDVKLLTHEYFCPVSNDVWEKLFRTPDNATFALFKKSYAVHAWSGKSKEEPLDLSSHQLYAVLAAENCPFTVARAQPWT